MNHRRIASAILTLIGIGIIAPSAFAHQRDVFTIGDKQYLFITGSLNEPAFVDDKSGVELRVLLADPVNPGDSASPNAKPVTGLESTLKAEVSAGDKKKVFDLKPTWGEPGSYYATFYPSVATTYAYRVFGTIENVPVDLVFACTPAGEGKSTEDTVSVQISDGVTRTLHVGSFGCFGSREGVTFPEPIEALAEVHATTQQTQWVAWVALAIAVLGLLARRKKL